jgi:putative SOS response-associated peptidase YedK
MRGRFASTLPPEQIARLFGTRNLLPNIGPNWNTAPTQEALVVRRHPETGERHLDALKWGLLPSWTKDAATANIVPVEAFFEWRRGAAQAALRHRAGG